MQNSPAGSLLNVLSIPFFIVGCLGAVMLLDRGSLLGLLLAAFGFFAFVVILGLSLIATTIHNRTAAPAAPITRKQEATYRCPDCDTEAPRSQFTPFPDNQVRCPNCLHLLSL
jgi:DNA-directed RNA polymerase subunit RPC12/RpoP